MKAHTVTVVKTREHARRSASVKSTGLSASPPWRPRGTRRLLHLVFWAQLECLRGPLDQSGIAGSPALEDLTYLYMYKKPQGRFGGPVRVRPGPLYTGQGQAGTNMWVEAGQQTESVRLVRLDPLFFLLNRAHRPPFSVLTGSVQPVQTHCGSGLCNETGSWARQARLSFLIVPVGPGPNRVEPRRTTCLYMHSPTHTIFPYNITLTNNSRSGSHFYKIQKLA